MKKSLLFPVLFVAATSAMQTAKAVPSVLSPQIHIDQFGYRCDAEKTAVVSDPQTGYNASVTFNPGTGTNNYEIRRWNDDVVVFTGTLKKWGQGATHAQSGDKVWWFTFTSFQDPGEYYVYDKVNQVASYRFRIGDDVYDEVLNTALRTFYVQRCGTEKDGAYAGSGWADAACHLASLQDTDCRLVTNPQSSGSRDLHGGWHDAGDYNKYVNFAWTPLMQMLLAYKENPDVWGDLAGIPESGNGIPDLMDEVRYELLWLLRMQEPDGSVLSLVGVQNYASASPPSADAVQRFYGPATTSASFTAASVFALGALQFYALNDPAMTAFADSLADAAAAAYDWASANPSVTYYNSGSLAAGEQEVDDYGRMVRQTAAALFLYELTGMTTYRDVFDLNYDDFHMMQWGYVYPFEGTEQDVLLCYTTVSGATSSVKSAIKSAYINSVKTTNPDNLQAYKNKSDAYRAYMADWNYTWGNNEFKCVQGTIFTNMLEYNLNAANAVKYKDAAAGFLHYLHGVNPVDIAYLSNMYDYGGDSCVNEFYHAWFTDGSPLWDRAGESAYGPAPGFIPGGANPYYALDGCCPNGCGGYNSQCNTASVTPPLGQPVQKSYRDWNAGWPQNSWQVTENAIYTQACYLKLLSWHLGGTCNELRSVQTDMREPDLLIWPNPASDEAVVDQENWENESGRLCMYSPDGRIVLMESNVELPHRISVSMLPPGTYIIRVMNAGKMLKGKLIVE